MKDYTVFSVKIGGAAGEGIKTIGYTLQKGLQRLGFYSFGYTEYPSLIRGGHNTYQVSWDIEPVHCVDNHVDIVVALNKEGVDFHLKELKKGGIIIYDSASISLDASYNKLRNIQFWPVNAKEVLEEHSIPLIMQNTFFVGVVFSVLSYPVNVLSDILAEKFKHKGEKIVEMNKKALAIGYRESLIKTKSIELHRKPTIPSKKESTIMVSANESIALGFLASGGRVYSSYPMTPSSSILHYLAKVGAKKGVLVRQASNEIEAIGLAAGASFSGTRSMVATSGGGMALMGEFISLLGVTEIPLVIVNAQRPGPGTGVPTWTEQGDLQFSIHIGHGDFPKVVIAPGDSEEAFFLTNEALNIADQYQIPVILLSDKHISESFETIKPFKIGTVQVQRGQIMTRSALNKLKKRFERYHVQSKDGVSPRSLPGQKNGIFAANSDEHDPFGYSTEDASMRNTMVEKRMKKLKMISKQLPDPKVFGDPRSKNLIIFWGSPKGAILETLKILGKRGKDFKVMQIQYLWPFPEDYVVKEIKKSKNSILIENNVTAQLRSYIRESGVDVDHVFTKYDGRPFWVSELVTYLEKHYT